MNVLQRYLSNPAYGLIPIFLFSFAIRWVGAPAALLIALALSVIGVLVVRKQSRLIYDVSAIAFFISLATLFFFGFQFDRLRTFVIVEVFFLLTLIVIRLSRTKIIVRLMTHEMNSAVKNFLNESFRVAFFTQYGFSIHLLLVLLYFIFLDADTSVLHVITLKITSQIIIVAIIVLEVARLRILNVKLKKEEWLPVVNEKGDVTGKIAKSVTRDMKNKFMHPVVRVALVHDGKIYLKKRAESRILDPGKLDYPFEKYMKLNHELDESVHNSIRMECKNDDIPLSFMLKYIFENNITKRLIFLYVSNIESDELYNSLHLEGGKLWTEAQIEDNMEKGLFSENFELEYEYLKNTVLMYNRVKAYLPPDYDGKSLDDSFSSETSQLQAK